MEKRPFTPDPRLEETKKVILPFLQAAKMLGKKYDDGSMSPEQEKEFDRFQWLQELKRQDELDTAHQT